jgi:hypothetical protein
MALAQEIYYKPEITYLCHECDLKFLFIHEITYHAELLGHNRIAELPLG